MVSKLIPIFSAGKAVYPAPVQELPKNSHDDRRHAIANQVASNILAKSTIIDPTSKDSLLEFTQKTILFALDSASRNLGSDSEVEDAMAKYQGFDRSHRHLIDIDTTTHPALDRAAQILLCQLGARKRPHGDLKVQLTKGDIQYEQRIRTFVVPLEIATQPIEVEVIRLENSRDPLVSYAVQNLADSAHELMTQ